MDSVLYCYSADQATDVHPTDVASWYCTTNSTGGSELVTPEEFSISCGCSAATDTTTDVGTGTTSTTTGTPVTTTTTDTGSSTCDDGESFTILSTIVPEAAGCYSDTGVTGENGAIYSETGTTDTQQNFVMAVDFGDVGVPDIRWTVAYLISDTTTTMDSVLYCYSADQATGVHPADVASWYCYENSGTDPELASVEEFSISCGCSINPDAIVSPTPEPIAQANGDRLPVVLPTIISVAIGFMSTAALCIEW